MSSMGDLLDDILPLVLLGVLDPEYIAGKKGNSPFGLPEPDENQEEDEGRL